MICSENVLVSCYLHVSALLLCDAPAAIVAVVPDKAGRTPRCYATRCTSVYKCHKHMDGIWTTSMMSFTAVILFDRNKKERQALLVTQDP